MRTRLFVGIHSVESRHMGLELTAMPARMSAAVFSVMDALGSQGKNEEAALLYLKVKRTREQALGPDHPSLAIGLSNWARVLREQVMYLRFWITSLFFGGGFCRSFRRMPCFTAPAVWWSG